MDCDSGQSVPECGSELYIPRLRSARVAWLSCSLGVSTAHTQRKCTSCKQMMCSLTVFFPSRCIWEQKGKDLCSPDPVLFSVDDLAVPRDSCTLLASGVILLFLCPHTSRYAAERTGWWPAVGEAVTHWKCSLSTHLEAPSSGVLLVPKFSLPAPWPHASLFPAFEVSWANV